jgi:O-antigen ligase
VIARLGTTVASVASADLGNRVKLWRAAVSVLAERPFVGVGADALRVTRVGGAAHNTLLSVMAELGIIGFLLFSGVLAITIHQALQHDKWPALFWLVVLAVWAIGASAQTWEYKKQTWLFLSLVVVSANLVRQAEPSIVHQISVDNIGRA